MSAANWCPLPTGVRRRKASRTSRCCHGFLTGLVSLTVVLAAAPALGSPVPLIGWEYDQVRPAIAYGPESAVYLAVWEDHHWGWGADWDIYGQRLDSAGAPVGGLISVSISGANARLAPAVAYNRDLAEFLVVWEYEYSATDHDIHAQRVAADGTLVGSAILVGNTGAFERRPRVAYNPADREYLVVWELRAGSDEFSQYDIYGQRLSGTGGALGGVIAIDTGLTTQLGPSVAHDRHVDEYLVVWQENVGGQYDVVGRRVSGGGALLGSKIPVCSVAYDQVSPRVAFALVPSEYLVVWEDHRSGSASDWDIYAQRLDGGGIPVGGSFAVSWDGTKNRLNPDLSYLAAADEYLVVWEFEYGATDHDVYARRVGGDGTLPDGELPVSSLGSSEQRPAVAAGATADFRIVWEDGRSSATMGLDPYADGFAVPTRTPTSSHTMTAVPTATPTRTVTVTATRTGTVTATTTATITATTTRSRTPTGTPSITSTPTSSRTATPTVTPSATLTRTATGTITHSATATSTPTATTTRTVTPSMTATATATWSRTPTGTATNASTFTATPSATASRTASASATASRTATATPTSTQTPTSTATRTATASPSAPATSTSTRTVTATSSATASPSATATRTASRTPTVTATTTPAVTTTATRTTSATATETPSRTATRTATPTPTAPDTATRSPSRTATPASSPTRTDTPTHTPTVSPSPTPPGPATSTPTITETPLPPVSLTVCAVEDATVDQVNPATNYGDAPTLIVGLHPEDPLLYVRRAFVRFDLSFVPARSRVLSAVFQAELIGSDGVNEVSVSVHAVRDRWQETVVSWSDQPETINPGFARTRVGSVVPSVIGWDVTELVQTWIDGEFSHHSMVLRGIESGAPWRRSFGSRQAAGVCPRLLLEVVPRGPMDTPTPLATATPTPTGTQVCPQPDAAGDTLSAAAAVNPDGFLIQDYVCPSGDTDWWKFRLEAGQDVVISLADMPRAPDADYDLLLVSPAGGLLGRSDQFGADRDESVSYLAYTPGDYRVAVYGKGPADWSKKQPYSLRITAAFHCFDPDEAGNTFASAGAIVPSIPEAGVSRARSGVICPAGDSDMYRFVVPGGETVTMNVHLRNLPADYDLYLYSPDAQVLGQSHNVGMADEHITRVATANMGGAWYVQVQPTSWAAYHSNPYELEVSLTGDADLSVMGVEVTQVVQSMSHGVPLIVGKPTVARVYVDVGPATGTVSNVSAELRAWRVVYGYPTQLLGTLKLGPRSVKKQSLLDQRLQYAASFNFVVPAEWQTGHPLRFEARVNPDLVVPETNFSNNSATVSSVEFVRRKPMNLGLVPVDVNGMVVTLPIDPLVKDMISWFRYAWPVHQVNIWYKAGGPLAGSRNYRWPPGGGCGSQWRDLVGDIVDIYDDWTDRPENAFIYGVMDPSIAPGPDNACGNVGSVGAAGILGSDGGATMAHELGHNVGRLHAPCGVPEKGKDTSYPTYTNAAGAAYPSASIGEVGVNVKSGTTFGPANARDLMSYCGPEWFSPYNYRAVLAQMPGGTGLTAALPPGDGVYLAASGEIRDGAVELPRPFWVLSNPAGAHDGPGEGTYSVELQDAAGAPLFLRRFDRRAGDADFPDAFREAMPFPANTARLVFRRESAVVRVVDVSPHAPSVRVLSPNGGETWDGVGPYTVSWEAGDADGDALTSRVLYSYDGGQSWQSLAVNLQTSSYDVDAAGLPGGAQALVRVLVSDGVNTSSDTSDAPFEVAPKPPVVLLLAPEAGAVLPAAEPIFLQAAVTDPEDGPLSDDALVWTDGSGTPVGTGTDVIVEGLAPGEHEFTVTATDGDGMTKSAGVAVLVSESPPPTPTPTPCVGDCGQDGAVTVDELVRLIEIALGEVEPAACTAGDRHGDGRVVIDELVESVGRALHGCSAAF